MESVSCAAFMPRLAQSPAFNRWLFRHIFEILLWPSLRPQRCIAAGTVRVLSQLIGSLSRLLQRGGGGAVVGAGAIFTMTVSALQTQAVHYSVDKAFVYVMYEY